MNLKATAITIILTAAACISSAAATDSLSSGTQKGSKGGKLARFLSEKVSVSGYAQAGYQYDTYDMAHDGAFNKFNLYRAMIIADIRSMRSTSGSDSTRPPSQSRAICLPQSWK